MGDVTADAVKGIAAGRPRSQLNQRRAAMLSLQVVTPTIANQNRLKPHSLPLFDGSDPPRITVEGFAAGGRSFHCGDGRFLPATMVRDIIHAEDAVPRCSRTPIIHAA